MTVFDFILQFDPTLTPTGISKIKVNGRSTVNPTAKVMVVRAMDQIEYVSTIPGFPACVVRTRVPSGLV